MHVLNESQIEYVAGGAVSASNPRMPEWPEFDINGWRDFVDTESRLTWLYAPSA